MDQDGKGWKRSRLGKLLAKLRKTGMTKHIKRNEWRSRIEACVLAKCGHVHTECYASCDTNSIDFKCLKIFVKFHFCADKLYDKLHWLIALANCLRLIFHKVVDGQFIAYVCEWASERNFENSSVLDAIIMT